MHKYVHDGDIFLYWHSGVVVGRVLFGNFYRPGHKFGQIK
jgi:hypothetical protein